MVADEEVAGCAKAEEVGGTVSVIVVVTLVVVDSGDDTAGAVSWADVDEAVVEDVEDDIELGPAADIEDGEAAATLDDIELDATESVHSTAIVLAGTRLATTVVTSTADDTSTTRIGVNTWPSEVVIAVKIGMLRVEVVHTSVRSVWRVVLYSVKVVGTHDMRYASWRSSLGLQGEA